MTIGMPPYEELPSFEGLLERAEKTATHKSQSYVEDAVLFSRWIRLSGKQIVAELDSAKNRCAELAQEVSVLKARIAELEGDEMYQATSARDPTP